MGTRPPGWIGDSQGWVRPSGDLLPDPLQLPLTNPPRWLFHGICLAATLWLFWTLSTPASDVFDGVTPVLLLFACALIWVVRLVVCARVGTARTWWNLVAPTGGALAVTLVLAHAPVHARFSLADDKLAAAAESILAAPDPDAAAREADRRLGRVGTYRVKDVVVRDGLVYFTLADGAFFTGPRGVMYAPVGVSPKDDSVREVEHFRGPWYYWWDLTVMD